MFSTATIATKISPILHLYVDGIDANSSLLSSILTMKKVLTLDGTSDEIRKILQFSKGPKELHGVTGFILAPGSHTTLHTYPHPSKKIIFCDHFGKETQSYVFFKKLQDYFSISEASPFGIHDRTSSHVISSTFSIEESHTQYGPHLTVELDLHKKYHMDRNYVEHCLSHLVDQIEMNKILGPFSVENREYLSGIVIIAESHISIHIDKKGGIAYVDIFSCKNFSLNTALREIKLLLPGVILNAHLFKRGKHFYEQ